MMLIQDLINYKFTQTDFIVIYYLNKQDLGLSELIEKTGYSRDTINSTLKRLLENKMVERSEGESGKFVYRIPEEMFIDFYDYISRIMDYLIENHRSALTPNICRILCYLFGYQAYSIADLIEDGWKPAATYNSTKKLLDMGIIEKDGSDFIFSKKIRNVGRKQDVLQHVRVATCNMNGYLNEGTFATRFEKFLPILNRSSIWGLQEVVPNAYPEIEEKIKDRGFRIIYPESYTEKNKNCMITTLVVAEENCDEYEPLLLGDDKLFNLRYTYGRLKTWNGRNLRILNVHIPQSYDVDKKRKQEIKDFWELIIEEAKACRVCEEEFILLGDFNAYNEEDEMSENAEYLQRLSDLMFDTFEDWDVDIDEEDELPEDWGYSWYSKDGKTKRRLDYIFVGYKIMEGTIFTKKMEDVTLERGISDHKAVILGYYRFPTDEEIAQGVEF